MFGGLVGSREVLDWKSLSENIAILHEDVGEVWGNLFLEASVEEFTVSIFLWNEELFGASEWFVSKKYQPRDSKWPLYPLVGGHLTFERVT